MSTPPNKTSWKPAAVIGAVVAGCGCLVLVVASAIGLAAWRHHRQEQRQARSAQRAQDEQEHQRQREVRSESPALNRIDTMLAAQPFTAVNQPDGIAVVVLVDTSGSMKDKVRDADGQKRRKLDIARRSVMQLATRAQAAAGERPRTPLLLGLYEFSVRNGQANCRPVVPLASPDTDAVRRALDGLRADGDTPIGDALVAARAALAATGCGHQHVLVVTDGENTKGLPPAEVVEALSRLPGDQRVSTYLIAFDVDAKAFDKVEDAGALVLPAAGGAELEQSLDYVLTGKILAEQLPSTGNDSGEVR